MLHYLRISLRITITQLHMHTVQQTRMHKAVTQRVEAKKLLSRRRQSNLLYILCNYIVTLLIRITSQGLEFCQRWQESICILQESVNPPHSTSVFPFFNYENQVKFSQLHWQEFFDCHWNSSPASNHLNLENQKLCFQQSWISSRSYREMVKFSVLDWKVVLLIVAVFSKVSRWLGS